MTAYPEHEKLRVVADQSQQIGAFLEWLMDEQGWEFAKYRCRTDGRDPVLTSFDLNITETLARYFDIDLVKVEQEKRAMLDAVRMDDLS